MNFVVQRRNRNSLCVTGEFLIGGVHSAYTMEPPYGASTVKPRAIPAGTYDLEMLFSPHFCRLMPHLLNVPDFTNVMIHWGNFPDETEGCILVGSMISGNFIGHSRSEFDALFLEINDALAEGPQTITVLDPPSGMAVDVDGMISI